MQACLAHAWIDLRSYPALQEALADLDIYIRTDLFAQNAKGFAMGWIPDNGSPSMQASPVFESLDKLDAFCLQYLGTYKAIAAQLSFAGYPGRGQWFWERELVDMSANEAADKVLVGSGLSPWQRGFVAVALTELATNGANVINTERLVAELGEMNSAHRRDTEAVQGVLAGIDVDLTWQMDQEHLKFSARVFSSKER